MPRALTFAKYLPAGLCGLLVVAWVVSWFITVHASWRTSNRGGFQFALVCGSARLWRNSDLDHSGFRFYSRDANTERSFLGRVQYVSFASLTDIPKYSLDYIIVCPLSWLLTLIAPFAIGCLNHFRFPLWSWFAFTALIAVELAFYLR